MASKKPARRVRRPRPEPESVVAEPGGSTAIRVEGVDPSFTLADLDAAVVIGAAPAAPVLERSEGRLWHRVRAVRKGGGIVFHVEGSETGGRKVEVAGDRLDRWDESVQRLARAGLSAIDRWQQEGEKPFGGG